MPKSAVVTSASTAGERQQPPVAAKFEPDRIVGRRQRLHDGRTRKLGKEKTQQARGAGDERAFDEHLLDEPQAAGADRQAQGHLALACRGPGEKQIGDVRAGDQQDQRRDSAHDPERALKLLAQR